MKNGSLYPHNSNQKVNHVGRIYHSNKYGDFRVIRELIGIGYKSRVFDIEFLNTGYRCIATRQHILDGRIKDRSVPLIYGVGCEGFTYYIEEPDMSNYYRIWSDMIRRCYCTTCKDYKTYGAVGVTVSPDWLVFANFYKDVKKLPGYENKKREPSMYKLDKDYLQQHIPMCNRIYSKDTCMWISSYENAMLSCKDNSYTGYFCVHPDFKNGYFYTKIYGIRYAKYRTAEEAACLFNYIYPLICIKPYCTLPMINNVYMIPFEELLAGNLLMDKTVLTNFYYNNYNVLSSTTIGEIPSRIQAYSKQ